MMKLVMFVVGVGLAFVGFRAYPLLSTLPGPLSVLAVVPKQGYMGLGGLLAVLSGAWTILGLVKGGKDGEGFVPVEPSRPSRRVEERPRRSSAKGGFFGLSWFVVVGVVVITSLVLIGILSLGSGQGQLASTTGAQATASSCVWLQVGTKKYPTEYLVEAFSGSGITVEESVATGVTEDIARTKGGCFTVEEESQENKSVKIRVPSCVQNCSPGPAWAQVPTSYVFATATQPTQIPLTKGDVEGKILTIPESKFSPLWQLFLPMLAVVAFWLLIWYIWIAITKPQLIEAWRFEFTFKGGGGATIEIRPTLRQMPEPGALARSRAVGSKEAKRQLRTVLEDLVSAAGSRLAVFAASYDNALRDWQDVLNQAFAQRAANLPYDTNLLLRLEQKEETVGWQVVTLDFSELEYDGQALAMLQEEADRRRNAKEQEQTLGAAYLKDCFAAGLDPRISENFKAWVQLQTGMADVEVRSREAQAKQVRAQALSELLEELSPEDIFRSIERIVAGAIGGRSRGGGVGRALQNMLTPSGRESAGEEA